MVFWSGKGKQRGVGASNARYRVLISAIGGGVLHLQVTLILCGAAILIGVLTSVLVVNLVIGEAVLTVTVVFTGDLLVFGIIFAGFSMIQVWSLAVILTTILAVGLVV